MGLYGGERCGNETVRARLLQDFVEGLVRGKEESEVAARGTVRHLLGAAEKLLSLAYVGMACHQRCRDRLQLAADLHDVGVILRTDIRDSQADARPYHDQALPGQLLDC